MDTPRIDFSYLLTSLQSDAELREQIREAVRAIEKDERALLATCNKIHSLTTQQSEFISPHYLELVLTRLAAQALNCSLLLILY